MKIWSTLIKAIDPYTGILKTYSGPNIPAPTNELARQYCQLNGLGYCEVSDEILEEIPYDENTGIIDYKNIINYFAIQNN